MRISTPLIGLVVAGAALAQATTPVAPDPTRSFPAFDARVGGHWQVQWHPATDTPRAIFGTGLVIPDWRGNTLVEARRCAERVLAEFADVLGLGASDFRESIGARMGRTWSFQFDQHFRGLPCIGGRADVRVNMKGVIAMLGSTAWPIPADFDTRPQLGEVEAEARAWLALDQQPTGVPQPGPARPTRLVIWGDSHSPQLAPFSLAWEVPIRNVDAGGQGPIGRCYIDARTGAMLHFQDDKHACGIAGCTGGHVPAAVAPPAAPVPTTVTVMAWTRTALSAVAPLVNIPVVGLQVTVPGAGNFVTDANGQFTANIAGPTTITVTNLDGVHNAPIRDATGANVNATVTVQPGVAATLQILTGGASQQQAAHTSTHYWVHRVNEWLRTIVGNSSQLAIADNMLPTVNFATTCNAYYTGNTINFYAVGGGCNNTAFSTVILHEWGHGLDDHYGGISNTGGDGLSEGWGDIIAMYLVDHPVVGIDFTTGGGFVRTGLNNTMYGTQTQVHAAGEVWMGFAWRLRENLRTAFGTAQAIAISDDIVVGSIVANAINQADAVREVFLADDDDGNLANGVPHYAQLSAAAIQKGIPYPQVQVAYINHAALGGTLQRHSPRLVTAQVGAVSSGSIQAVRLWYQAGGSPTQSRQMVPYGGGNDYRALLPGVSSGIVTYHLEATHSGGTVVRSPVTGQYGYSVLAVPTGPFTGFYLEDFESGAAGWSHARRSGIGIDDWQLGAPQGRSGIVSGWAWSDPPAAASGSNVYGTNLGAGSSTGRHANNIDYSLFSPVIDCSGRTGVYVRFKRWLSVEAGIYDRAVLQLNGAEVWSNQTGYAHLDNGWVTVEYALPLADNNPAVQLEWRLIANATVNLGGWQIDDVEVGTRAMAGQPAILRWLPEQVAPATPMTMSVATLTGPQLFAVGISGSAGPTLLPGLPELLVGSPMITLSGVTDAGGNWSLGLTSFPSAPAGGLLLHSQVLTLDAAGGWAVSNPYLNLFTP